MHPDSAEGTTTLPITLRFCLEQVTAIAPKGRILDYGCGAGLAVAKGAERGLDIYGCETFYGGGSSKALAEQHGVLGTRVLEMGPEYTIPFADASFDVVYHNQVFEHVPDLSLTLREIARVLKPGGTMLSLFPFENVWREGHIGVAFAHKFLPSSKIGHAYVSAMYRLGFGYHRVPTKTPDVWTRDALTWIRDWCHYRPQRDVERAYKAAGFSVEYREPDLIRYRLAVTQKPYAGFLNRVLDVAPSLGTFAFQHLGHSVILSRRA